MSFNCDVTCHFPIAMRFEDNSNPNEKWQIFKDEFLKLESKALEYNKEVFKELNELKVNFDPNDECEIYNEESNESTFVEAYTPEFSQNLSGQEQRNYFFRGKGANCIDSIFYEFLRKNNPLTRWNTPYVIYEHIQSEYDDLFVGGIRFLGEGKYVMLRDNTQFDVVHSFDEDPPKYEVVTTNTTEILDANLDKEIFEKVY
jgi:hypothetical protein